MFLLLPIAAAQTVTVPGDYPDLHTAMAAIANGATIQLTADVTVSQVVSPTRPVTIDGVGFTIFCPTRCFRPEADLTLTHLTLAPTGAVVESYIYVAGSPVVRLLQVEAWGGEAGVYVDVDQAGRLVVVDSHFHDNAGNLGTVIRAQGSVDIASSVFEDNHGLSVIDSRRSLTITGSTFRHNVVIGQSNNGTIFAEGQATITDSLFEANTHQAAIASSAGGPAVHGENLDLTLSRNRFCRNTTSRRGAAVYTNNGMQAIHDNLFLENTTEGTGSAIYVADASALEVQRNTLVRNASANGSALHIGNVQGPASVEGNLLVDNASGGFYSASPTQTANAFYGNGQNTTAGADNSTVFETAPAPGFPNSACEFASFALAPTDGPYNALAGPFRSFGVYQDDDADGWSRFDDCDDDNPIVSPGATEVCGNGFDEDCNGIDDPPVTAYPDADGDGFGDLVGQLVCEGSVGFVPNSGDCDDADHARHPGQVEVCNYRDDNCDGAVDEGLAVVRWMDADGDGFGTGPPLFQCVDTGAPEPGDCNDADREIYPGAPERCNGLDDDCDGQQSDPITYTDLDDDGFGVLDQPLFDCSGAPNPGDCNDEDPDSHPGAEELPADDVDQDCDGLDPGYDTPLGVACASGTSPTGMLALVLLGLTHRRRAS